MILGRTELRIGGSRAKFDVEVDGEVHLAVAPPKPIEINEKIILLKPKDSLPDINFNKGEFVIIIENNVSKKIIDVYDDEDIVNKLKELLDLKFTGKDSIRITSNYLGVNQKKIYNMYLNNFNEK